MRWVVDFCGFIVVNCGYCVCGNWLLGWLRFVFVGVCDGGFVVNSVVGLCCSCRMLWLLLFLFVLYL